MNQLKYNFYTNFENFPYPMIINIFNNINDNLNAISGSCGNMEILIMEF